VFGTSYYSVRERWFVTHPHFKAKILGLRDEAAFNEQLKDFLLRVDSDEVLDLPETIETFVQVPMSPRARKHYREVEQQLCTMVADEEITVANALGKLLKMRQIVSGFILDENHTAIKISNDKIEVLEELIEEIGEKEPVVVFTNFKYEMLDVKQLASRLGRTFYEISGSSHDYEKIHESPNPIIGVQIQSGGAGIDLSMSAYCIYYSLTYSLGDYLQSRKRVHRPGQTRTTRYYHLTCEDTLDQVIYKALTTKEDVVNGILNELKRKVH
jgi:SNF2 family DNA or RNA helicase